MFHQHLYRSFKSQIKGEGFRNFVRLLTIDSLVKASGIILLPVYLRLMTPDEFGLFGYVTALVAYLAMAVSGGLFVVQSKMYFEYPDRPNDVLFTLNILLFFLVAVIFVVIVVFNLDQLSFEFLFKHPINFFKFRWPFLIGVFAAAFSYMLVNYYLASRQIKKLQSFNLLRIGLIHLVVIVLLISFDKQNGALIRLFSTSVVEVLLVIGFGALLFRDSRKLKFDRAIAKRALLLVYPITLLSVFSLVIFLSDRFYLERLGTRQDLATYNLAWTMAGVIPFISNSLHSIWMPLLLEEKDQAVLRSRVKGMAFKLIVGFGLVSIALLALTKLMLTLGIIGEAYNKVLPVLPVVLVGVTFLSLFQLRFNYLVSLSRFNIFIHLGLGVGLLALVVAPTFVKAWGVMGAAFSMLTLNFSLLVASLFPTLKLPSKFSLPVT